MNQQQENDNIAEGLTFDIFLAISSLICLVLLLGTLWWRYEPIISPTSTVLGCGEGGCWEVPQKCLWYRVSKSENGWKPLVCRDTRDRTEVLIEHLQWWSENCECH